MPGNAAVRVREFSVELPHSHDGIYGELNTGENMRVYLDKRDWKDMGYPDAVRITVQLP